MPQSETKWTAAILIAPTPEAGRDWWGKFASGCILVDSDGIAVGATCDDGIPTIRDIANAQLFHAAPDLHAALEERLQFTPRGPCQKGLMPVCRCQDCKDERSRAALAKARGEHPGA